MPEYHQPSPGPGWWLNPGPGDRVVAHREVRRLLLRDDEPRQVDEAAEQLRGPAADGDHGTTRGDRSAVGLDLHAVVVEHADAAGRRLMAHVGPARGRRRLERPHRGIRVETTGGRQVQRPGREADAGPPAPRLVGRQELARDADRGERGAHVVMARVLAVVDEAHLVEDRRAGLGLELAPGELRLEQHGDVRGLGVGEVEVAGRAVGRAVRVAGREALEQRDLAAAAGEVPCRGGAHRSPADHDDVGVDRGHEAIPSSSGPSPAAASTSIVNASSRNVRPPSTISRSRSTSRVKPSFA